MTRDQALRLLDEKLNNKNLIKHCLAVEVIMRDLAEYFGEDVEVWGMAGLLHDIDYEATANDWSRHGILAKDWLAGYGLSEEIFEIIRAHNSDALNIERKTRAEKAIFAVDPISGLVIASALMTSEKKIRQLTSRSVLKKFKNKKFAAGLNRESISTCEDIGLSLEKFIEISLSAMKRIERR